MNRYLLLLFFLLMQITEALAGPGGKIAKQFFNTPLGKIIAVILVIVFLPLVISNHWNRRKAKKSTLNQLQELSQIDHRLFDIVSLNNRVTDIFKRVHKAWSEQDLDDCDQIMTSWFNQNQQTVYLDEWKSRGMKNICSIKKINKINPIHIRLTDEPNFEGSRIMYSIDAEMEDYLVSETNSSIIEGEKGFNDVETIWTFQLTDGTWVVDNIEEDTMFSTYIKMDSPMTDRVIKSRLEAKGLA